MKHILFTTAVLLLASDAFAQTPKKQPTNPGILRRPNTPWATLSAGYNRRVKVYFASRLDWTMALPVGVSAKTPGHDPASTIYQLYIPPTYRHNQPHPMILFVPADSNAPDERLKLEAICRKYSILFACPYGAGNDCAPALRTRIAIEVLEDMRRRFHIDTDRTYVAGFSSGSRIATEIAFAYPEYVGGLLAIGGVGGLRGEGWLRDRVRERLPVAVAYGDADVVRSEVERWRLPALRDAQVNVKSWLAPRTAHAMPEPTQLEEMIVWLESSRPDRVKLALRFPTSRANNGAIVLPEVQSAGLLEEASKRLEDRKLRESGILQLAGIVERFDGTPAAVKAKKLLDQRDARAVLRSNQQQYLWREARGLDAYLAGTLSQVEQAQKSALLAESLRRWQAVEKLDPATKEGKTATRRIGELRDAVEQK